jgi:transcriptional regulator with XRE-family HTH domain
MASGAGTIGRVAARIRARRRKRRLTQTALTKAAGVSRELSRLEAGRHDPKLSVLERIANALKVPLATLVKGGAVDALCRATSR